jgi:hypothetical protein
MLVIETTHDLPIVLKIDEGRPVHLDGKVWRVVCERPFPKAFYASLMPLRRTSSIPNE